MKVLVLHSDKTWCNGLLVYREAKHQGKDVDHDRTYSGMEYLIGRAKKYDWVLITGMQKLSPEEMLALKKVTRLAVWDADALNEQRRHQWNLRKDCVDLVMTSVMENVMQFDKVFPAIVWTPQFYDARFVRPTEARLENSREVAFVGNTPGDAKRPKWISALSQEFDMNLAGWIKGQSDIQSPNSVYKYGTELADIYANSKVTIDIKRSHPFEYGVLTMSDRIYKAMGCGSMFIVYPIPKLESMFTDGEHLVVYSGELDDLKEKIRYYLKHDAEREKIAKAGRHLIMKEHTLEKRLNQYWGLMEESL